MRTQLSGLDHLWQFNTGAVSQLVAGGPRRAGRRGGRAPRRHRPVRPRHPHLHLRHHRPPQGLRPHPRQLLRRGRQRRRAAPPRLQVGQRGARLHPPLPAPLPRLRPDGRRRLSARPRPPRPRPQHPDRRPARRPGGLPADLPPRHPVRPGEGLQHRPCHRGEDGPRLLLRPRGPYRPLLRRGGRGQGTRDGRRPRRRPQSRPQVLRPARLPPYPRRPRRQGPPRPLRRLPARPPPRRLLHRRRHRDLRGLRPDGDPPPPPP